MSYRNRRAAYKCCGYRENVEVKALGTVARYSMRCSRGCQKSESLDMMKELLYEL
jgi:hypothetical protein